MPRPRTVHVRLAGAYRIQWLDRLIRDLGSLVGLVQPARATVDLSSLVAVGPSAIALLTAVLTRCRTEGLFAPGSVLILPSSPPVRNYLLRMDLVSLVAPGGPPEPIARNPAVGFRSCREFITAEESQTVARELTDALSERCSTDAIARAAIRICLDELAENVIHHAASHLGCFAAAQGWTRNQQFEIAIVDIGVGIWRSLTKNPRYADIADDVTAITTALQPRVTSTPERNAGIGLFITRLLLRDNGGLLLVRSGSGEVYSGAEEGARETDISFPGTLVALRARTDRPLDLGPVYRRLDDDDGNKGDDDQAG